MKALTEQIIFKKNQMLNYLDNPDHVTLRAYSHSDSDDVPPPRDLLAHPCLCSMDCPLLKFTQLWWWYHEDDDRGCGSIKGSFVLLILGLRAFLDKRSGGVSFFFLLVGLVLNSNKIKISAGGSRFCLFGIAIVAF